MRLVRVVLMSVKGWGHRMTFKEFRYWIRENHAKPMPVAVLSISFFLQPNGSTFASKPLCSTLLSCSSVVAIRDLLGCRPANTNPLRDLVNRQVGDELNSTLTDPIHQV